MAQEDIEIFSEGIEVVTVIKKHIGKIVSSLLIAAVCAAGASVLKVERLDERVRSVEREISNNEKAHDRIERKVDLLIEKLIDN
jgi:hypothetical protein